MILGVLMEIMKKQLTLNIVGKCAVTVISIHLLVANSYILTIIVMCFDLSSATVTHNVIESDISRFVTSLPDQK